MANVFEIELLYLLNSEGISEDNESVLYKALLKYCFLFFIFLNIFYIFYFYLFSFYVLLKYQLNGRCRST